MIFVDASPMMIKLIITACWVRLSSRNSSLPKPSTGDRICSRLPNVIQIIFKTVHCHTGRASANTFARNFNGKSAGVSKSTLTPSRSSSSTCSPPRSKSVVPGGASTNKSRSLPSWSVPSNTDPNTLGFEMRKRPTTSLTAARCWSRAVEGFTVHLNGIQYLTSLAAQVAGRHMHIKHLALNTIDKIEANSLTKRVVLSHSDGWPFLTPPINAFD